MREIIKCSRRKRKPIATPTNNDCTCLLRVQKVVENVKLSCQRYESYYRIMVNFQLKTYKLAFFLIFN